MPIGFQSITSSGVVQLDSTVKHLVYKATDTLTSFTTLVSGVSKTCSVSFTGEAPVICLLEGTGVLLKTVKSGSDYTFTIVTKTAVSSVTYYIFDVISGSPTGNFGLQLFTPSGELSFDSNQRHLIPKELLSIDDEQGITVTSGRTYAIAYSKFPITGIEGVPQPPEDEFSIYKRATFFPTRTSSTLLSLEFWKWRGDSATSLGETAAGGSSIARATVPVTASIIDVTDIIGTNSLASALGDVTLSGTGSVPFIGTLSSTLGDVTVSGTGNLDGAITGSLSSTLGNVTVSGTGSVPFIGILSSTLGDVTVSGTGSVPFIGSLSSTLGDVTVSGTGNTFVPITVTRTSGTGATETVPTGATSVRIRVGGGGGAGGCRGSVDSGGGGGEGGFCESTIAVIGGNTMTYTVGAAVAGRSTVGSGTNGNSSSVSGTVSGGSVSMTANGGAGGGLLAGGAGGTASGGSTNTTGAPGEDSGSGSAGGSGNSTQSGAGGAGSLAPDPSDDGIRGEIEFYYT